MGEIECTDRYQALGIPYPDPDTMCEGQCEGTGWVPMFCQYDTSGLLCADDPEEDPRLIILWRRAHKEAHTLKGIIKAFFALWKVGKTGAFKHLLQGWKCDGWHFVKCPDCKGTGINA